MTHLGTCGHELYTGDLTYGITTGGVSTLRKSQARDGAPVVSYETLCRACYARAVTENEVFETFYDADVWQENAMRKFRARHENIPIRAPAFVFQIDGEDATRLDAWLTQQREKAPTLATADERFEYAFMPTGFGMITVVRDCQLHEEIDLTDYASW